MEAKDSESKSDSKVEDSEVLMTVSKYFEDQAFGASKDEGLEVVYEDFIMTYCHEFADAAESSASGEGHKIEFSELHGEYLRLFEKTCEFVLEANGFSKERFMNECQKVSARWIMRPPVSHTSPKSHRLRSFDTVNVPCQPNRACASAVSPAKPPP